MENPVIILIGAIVLLAVLGRSCVLAFWPDSSFGVWLDEHCNFDDFGSDSDSDGWCGDAGDGGGD